MLNVFSKRKNRKVVIIGLDGVPYTLLADYMSGGIMPKFSELCKNGTITRMRSSLPEISSVAWSNFITGKGPGNHGIFGFMEIYRQTYDYTFPNFNSLKEKPVWERENIDTVAFNIPQTYPAKPMNGIMVSGFVAIDLKKAVYPERVYHYLNGIGYKIDVNAELASSDPDAFFKDLFETFAKRKQAIEYLYDNEDWQLFIGTVTETDRLHHFFFDSAKSGNYYHIFERFYRELDSFIDTMAKKAMRDGAVLMTCSDHGFTPIKTEVYLNRWLIENDYLKLNGKDGLKGITNDSKAFCLDPSRIYIHLEGKYGRGPVKQTDYKALTRELKEKFHEITFDGQRVIKQIYLKEEIFSGNYADDGPDLYLLPNYGFDLKGNVKKDTVFSTTHFKGMHTYDDAHMFLSVPEEEVDDICIDNVMEVTLKYLK